MCGKIDDESENFCVNRVDQRAREKTVIFMQEAELSCSLSINIGTQGVQELFFVGGKNNTLTLISDHFTDGMQLIPWVFSFK